MKTLELKLKKDVLIVEAPLDAYDVSIGTHCIGVRTNENVEKDTNGFYHIYKKGLFFGDVEMKLEFLCKGSELTEEIASELVEEHYMNGIRSYEIYNDYKYNDSRWLDDAKESFISAVESKEKFWLENPIEKPINRDEYYKSEKVDSFEILLQQWQEAEEKTFRNPLIFVKK